jgi:hypothetical protein
MVHMEEVLGAAAEVDLVVVDGLLRSPSHCVEHAKGKLRRLARTLYEYEAKVTSVQLEMVVVQRERDKAVGAPVSGDRDPTTWLPDELMIRILLLVPLKSLLTRQCAGVCRRWRALVKMGPVDRRRRGGRWVGYAEGWVKPRLLHLGHTAQVLAVAVGPTGNLYAGSEDGTVRVWDHVHATLIRTLVGHAEAVYALAVSRTDVVYSGSDDTTIQVWSGGDGAHIRTLVGHQGAVTSLAVGLKDTLYSGSSDETVRVWSTRDGAQLQILEGHTGGVSALLIRADGRLYSGSWDTTIRVWSGETGVHLETLHGHSAAVKSLSWGAVDSDLLYSGSKDGTIRAWSGGGSTVVKTTKSSVETVMWIDGTMFAGLYEDIWVWDSNRSDPADPPSCVLDGVVCGDNPLALGINGEVFAVLEGGPISMM